MHDVDVHKALITPSRRVTLSPTVAKFDESEFITAVTALLFTHEHAASDAPPKLNTVEHTHEFAVLLAIFVAESNLIVILLPLSSKRADANKGGSGIAPEASIVTDTAEGTEY